jgi:hypothetical protein
MTVLIDDFPHPHPNGLGVTFAYVLWQMLRLRDQDFRVRITKENNPYRCERGPNPWDYYFEQEPAVGPFTNALIEHPLDLALSGHRDWTLARQRAIQPFADEHIKLRSEIQAEVDSFKAQFFRGTVLALHLRGTDKIEEYRPMLHVKLLAAITELKNRLKPDTIFLMTDDVDYHKLMQPLGAVSQTMRRSKKSLHHNPPNGRYESGLSVVMDGWLAAAADWFFYTPSNTAVIPLALGKHKEIGRLNAHCEIFPFCQRVDRALGLL